MTKSELQNKIDEVTMELRALIEDVKNTDKAINMDEAKAKQSELLEKRAKLEKEMAEMARPQDNGTKEVRTGWGKLADGMQKRAATTLSGSGNIATVKELSKAIINRYDILNGAKFFYGENAGTNIPVWGTGLAAAFQAEGGSGTPPATSVLNVTSLTAREALATLPISKMALDLSSVALESELPGIFADAFGLLMADGMINGKVAGDTVCMTGIFDKLNGATVYTSARSLSKLAELARTVKAKNYANPVIVMSPKVYGEFVADTATGEDVKIYKECLIRDKMIEDVKIILTAFAPSSGTGSSGAWADGDVIAVAGDLNNYAIGVASEVAITPKQTAGTTITTFDAVSYFAGKPINAADFIQYRIDV